MNGMRFTTGDEVTAAPARTAGPCAVVIFGATGDLAGRKLIPALYNLHAAGSLPEGTAVVGVSRGVPERATWAGALRATTEKHSRTGVADDAWDGFARRLHTLAGDLEDADTFARLAALLKTLEAGTEGNLLVYLSTPSSAFPGLLGRLTERGLVRRGGHQPWSRIIVEKPFGHDLHSARDLNALATSVLDEAQIYRIDHYLGKETVQNLLVLRFGNSIFEPIWNSRYIDHVQITAAETIGIEGRGRFYEETGILRDIIQNHQLQVLALTTMEPPISMDADEIRDMKAQVLRAVRPIDHDALDDDVVLGQYRGYHDERGVAPDSRVPTYAALRLYIDNWRWQGVPFYLVAGKALRRRRTEIRVVWKSIPQCLFGREDVCLRIDPNELVIRVQPDEGVALRFASKVPGDDLSIAPVTMDFRYQGAFQKAAPEAYERLLLDAIRGDATLFARRDEVDAAWRFIDPLLRVFEQDGRAPEPYLPGSSGPDRAEMLPRADGRVWESP